MGQAELESDGINVFVIYDGKRIAERGWPDTPQAGTWVSIEPGYTVWAKNYPRELVVEYEGKVASVIENATLLWGGHAGGGASRQF